MAQENQTQRWRNYRTANYQFPTVRRAELSKLIECTDPQEGEIIVEIGTGNGYLTFPLAASVGMTGIIHTFDYERENLESVQSKNTQNLNIKTYLQETNPQTANYLFPFNDGTIDKVATIATLHHYDDRSKETGISGRTSAIREFYRILRSGGRLVIADVAHNTNPQRYFDDAIDNPKSSGYCLPIGHPHDFLDKDLAFMLCVDAGFKNIEFEILPTPWRFDTEEQAGLFLKTLHNQACSPKESLEEAKRYLPFTKQKWVGEELVWELFYLIAEK